MTAAKQQTETYAAYGRDTCEQCGRRIAINASRGLYAHKPPKDAQIKTQPNGYCWGYTGTRRSSGLALSMTGGYR